MRKLIGALFIFLSTSSSLATSSRCESLFAKNELEATISALASLELKLNQAVINNDMPLTVEVLRDKFKRKLQSLLGHVVKNNLLTASEVNAKLEAEVIRLQSEMDAVKDREKKNRDAHATIVLEKKIDGKEIILNKVKGGKVKYILTDYDIAPFDLMATTTTHFMWRKVIELGKKHMNLIDERLIDDIPTGPDDIPIMLVSYEQIILWISVLNSLSAMGVTELLDFIPTFQKGDTFSLPTEEQWYFILTSGGTNYSSYYFFGDDVSSLKDYAWFDKNSGSTVQPVAKLLPLVHDGHDFYDVVGNVWQATYKAPPRGAQVPEMVLIWGGSAQLSGAFLGNVEKGGVPAKSSNMLIGFRLTRAPRVPNSP